MEIDTRLGKYWEQQAVAQYQVWRDLDDTQMKTAALFWLRDRLEKLTAGRALASDHRGVERKLQTIDRNLKLRWEFDHPTDPAGMWAVDYFVEDYGYHFTLFYWSHRLGEGGAMWYLLNEGDMQRVGSEAYLKQKREASARIRETLAKQRTEQCLAAVDRLTLKQCQQFIEVERALQYGEKIHLSGKDADIMNALYDRWNKTPPHLRPPAPPGIENAINRNPYQFAQYRRNRER